MVNLKKCNFQKNLANNNFYLFRRKYDIEWLFSPPPPKCSICDADVSHRYFLFYYFLNLQKSGDYLAIPITINVVLIISDTLLIWACGARNRILIWPWLIIHFLEFLFFIAALIFAMVIVPEPWFKVT